MIPATHRLAGLRSLAGVSRFRRLIAAQVVSQAADGLYQIALAAVLIFDVAVADTPEQVTKILAVTLIPFSVVGPFTGPFIDRFSRRSILVGTSLVRAVLVLLLIFMLTVFLLGFFFDWIEIALIIFPIFGPIMALQDFGDHVAQNQILVWFAVLVAINLQTSYLTPPFGFALFYLRGVAPPELGIRDIYRGVIPFVGLQILVMMIALIYPALLLWLPWILL
jgi:MFS family permease